MLTLPTWKHLIQAVSSSRRINLWEVFAMLAAVLLALILLTSQKIRKWKVSAGCLSFIVFFVCHCRILCVPCTLLLYKCQHLGFVQCLAFVIFSFPTHFVQKENLIGGRYMVTHSPKRIVFLFITITFVYPGDTATTPTEEVKNKVFRQNWNIPPWNDVIKDGLSEPGESISLLLTIIKKNTSSFFAIRFYWSTNSLGDSVDGLSVWTTVHSFGRPQLEKATAHH